MSVGHVKNALGSPGVWLRAQHKRLRASRLRPEPCRFICSEVCSMARLFGRISTLAAVAAAATVLAIVAHAQTMGAPERYVANAVDMNRGGANTIEIAVDRWSTDAQRDKLMS